MHAPAYLPVLPALATQIDAFQAFTYGPHQLWGNPQQVFYDTDIPAIASQALQKGLIYAVNYNDPKEVIEYEIDPQTSTYQVQRKFNLYVFNSNIIYTEIGNLQVPLPSFSSTPPSQDTNNTIILQNLAEIAQPENYQRPSSIYFETPVQDLYTISPQKIKENFGNFPFISSVKEIPIGNQNIEKFVQGINAEFPYFVFLKDHLKPNTAHLFCVRENQAYDWGLFRFYRSYSNDPSKVFVYIAQQSQTKENKIVEREPQKLTSWLENFVKSQEYQPLLEISEEQARCYKECIDLQEHQSDAVLRALYTDRKFHSLEETKIESAIKIFKAPTFSELIKLNKSNNWNLPFHASGELKDKLDIPSYFFFRPCSLGPNHIAVVTRYNYGEILKAALNIVSISEHGVLVSLDQPKANKKTFFFLDTFAHVYKEQKYEPIIAHE